VKNKRAFIAIPILIIMGAVFGALAKAGDVAIQGTFWGYTLYSFGIVSTEIFVWVAMCTIIAVSSDNKIWAAVNVFIFLVAMILSYYSYSYFVVGYFVSRVVRYWLIMLIPATVAGFIVWHIKINQVFKYVVIVLVTVILIHDIHILVRGYVNAIIIDIILYIIFMLVILPKRARKN